MRHTLWIADAVIWQISKVVPVSAEWVAIDSAVTFSGAMARFTGDAELRDLSVHAI